MTVAGKKNEKAMIQVPAELIEKIVPHMEERVKLLQLKSVHKATTKNLEAYTDSYNLLVVIRNALEVKEWVTV
jgi:hypothetical protein